MVRWKILTRVPKEYDGYKLDLVDVQMVRCDKKGYRKSRGVYFVLWKRKQKSSIETGILVHHKIVLAVEFVSDRMTYLVLGVRSVKSLFECPCTN
jgi:hypothetical protein